MSEQVVIRVQHDDFDPGLEIQTLHQGDTQAGAVSSFVGLVRDLDSDPLKAMVLEHYPGMTEMALANIVAQAQARWPLGRVTVIHRVGELHPLDRIVFVGVSSAHRDAAFAACSFIMDYLKRDAPFWKKELAASGERWVEQKASDVAKAKSWDS